MERNFNKSQLIAMSSMIVLAVITRFLPHPPNFTAIGAMALFAASTFTDKRIAFLVPILAMIISDLFIPFGFNPSVYLAFVAIVGIGFLLRAKIGFLSVITASLASSIAFFFITNTAVWFTSGFYAKNYLGLLTCYEAAIPFFGNTIAGDLFFCGLFFGSYSIMKKTIPALAK